MLTHGGREGLIDSLASMASVPSSAFSRIRRGHASMGKKALDSWLIDTALFKSRGPGSPQRSSLRSWIEANEAPLFLSAASLVELEAAIDKIPASRAERASALRKWLNDLVATLGDRIHPADASSDSGRGLDVHGFVRVCALTRQTQRPGQYIYRAGRASLKGTYLLRGVQLAAGGAAGERHSVANLARVARLKQRHE